MVEFIFYFFCFVAVLSALVILFSKNILYAAFSLVATFMAVAGIYVIAGAEFVAITQIMVYVGGIVVLLIFGVMLTNKISGKAMITESRNKFSGAIVMISLSALLIYAIFRINFSALQSQSIIDNHTNNPAEGFNNINHLGIGLMSDYILPFEIAAVLLLIALVGAATVAGYKERSDGH
ncbi:NADH-quinone oxidoreductase subunit J [Fulvivirga sp. 29W222]|uniref:NADH-quinone oxidoreductase subunit J n=1 Tax=Fulvivirga marina TaxID=2494733 RepID=A0A937KBD3_9BACT|nr:NADH-quinone oxidoreductase subunit J [Fulvivirga marina]MBL6445804.1 NADH-quinone oxidoreductase subunit J [Fulvivirga marina]